MEAEEAANKCLHRCNPVYPAWRWSVYPEMKHRQYPFGVTTLKTLRLQTLGTSMSNNSRSRWKENKECWCFLPNRTLSNIKGLWRWELLYYFYHEPKMDFCFSGKCSFEQRKSWLFHFVIFWPPSPPPRPLSGFPQSLRLAGEPRQWTRLLQVTLNMEKP